MDMFHLKNAGLVMENIRLEDIVYVPVKCELCEQESEAPTLKHILENKETVLSKMLEENGYVPIQCGACTKEETTE